MLARLRAAAEAEIEAAGGFRGAIRPAQGRAHLVLDRLEELEQQLEAA